MTGPTQETTTSLEGVNTGAPTVRWLDIDERHAGQRIDNFLLMQLKGVPKSRIYKILRKGEVRVNKGRIKPDYKLRAGDRVRIPPVRVAEPSQAAHPGRHLSQLLKNAVLYQDDQLLVINKPSGLAVHGGSGINLGLIEALRKLYPEQRYLELVHRLDRETSGCLMVAKSRSMLLHLQRQMQSGAVCKRYQALVAGKWPRGLVEVAAPLRKNQLQSGERVVRVSEQGKPAVTYFRALQQFKEATLVEAKLETGRTHQIRVHCQAAGHGLAGDQKYGNAAFNSEMKKRGLKRMFLHAAELAFNMPDETELTIVSPLPEDLSALIADLRVEE